MSKNTMIAMFKALEEVHDGETLRFRQKIEQLEIELMSYRCRSLKQKHSKSQVEDLGKDHRKCVQCELLQNSLDAVYRLKGALEIKLSGALSEIEELSRPMNNLNQTHELSKSEVNALQNKIKNNNAQINKLKQKIKNKDGYTKNLEKKNKKVLNELKQLENNWNQVKSRKDPNGKKLDKLLTSLEEHLQCPILLETFQNPVLTPSGNTVEGSVMKTLVQNKALDPFTRNGVCKELIPNLLVRQISELVAKFSY